jgi:hypothetical protein
MAPHLALAHEGFVERLSIFNTIPPMLNEAYAKAGIPENEPVERRSVIDPANVRGAEKLFLLF